MIGAGELSGDLTFNDTGGFDRRAARADADIEIEIASFADESRSLGGASAHRGNRTLRRHKPIGFGFGVFDEPIVEGGRQSSAAYDRIIVRRLMAEADIGLSAGESHSQPDEPHFFVCDGPPRLARQSEVGRESTLQQAEAARCPNRARSGPRPA